MSIFQEIKSNYSVDSLHFSQMSFKRKRPGDWGTLGDGFEGLDVDKPQVKRQKDRGLPGARRLYTSKKDMNDDPS